MTKKQVGELAAINEELRTICLERLRRLKAEAAVTILELEGSTLETQRTAAGILLYKAETYQRIIEQLQAAIGELDQRISATSGYKTGGHRDG